MMAYALSKILKSGLSIGLLFISLTAGYAQQQNGWTIIYYAVGSNSSELGLLKDIDEMIKGKTSSGYEVITLIDRIEGYSENEVTLGENFADTRMYRFANSSYMELDGGSQLPEIRIATSTEANMADADLLKRFIQYCKSKYPAKHYMLVLRSHGNGVGMCPDAESGVMDRLFPGEMRDVLTIEESVDILGLDVCSMAGLENFFEWRPDGKGFSADYILASAPLSAAWAYDDIFKRLQLRSVPSNERSYFKGGMEKFCNPYNMTPIEFSELLIEEIYDSQHWASWALIDNRKISLVKQKVDQLAKLLVLEDNDSVLETIEESLSYYHNIGDDKEVAQLSFPYVDAYHFFDQICGGNFNEETKVKANEVCVAIDMMVVHSYYGQGFLPEVDDFKEGKNGVYLILPMGHKIFSRSGNSFWQHTSWFHPEDKSMEANAYGSYDWCSVNAIRGNNKVDNFYEYLDYLFDESNNSQGGVNNYQW